MCVQVHKELVVVCGHVKLQGRVVDLTELSGQMEADRVGQAWLKVVVSTGQDLPSRAVVANSPLRGVVKLGQEAATWRDAAQNWVVRDFRQEGAGVATALRDLAKVDLGLVELNSRQRLTQLEPAEWGVGDRARGISKNFVDLLPKDNYSGCVGLDSIEFLLFLAVAFHCWV